jgi:hypothetical protein
MKLQSWKGGVYRVQGPGSRVRGLGISAARQWVGWERRSCCPVLEAKNSKPQIPLRLRSLRHPNDEDLSLGTPARGDLRSGSAQEDGAPSISDERASGELRMGHRQRIQPHRPSFHRRQNIRLKLFQEFDVQICWERRFREILVLRETGIDSVLNQQTGDSILSRRRVVAYLYCH